jgi:osmotically-inducible protein OsmY
MQVLVALQSAREISPERIVLQLSKRELEQQMAHCPDSEIVEAIKCAFQGTPAFLHGADYLAIDVTCHAGVVDLHGNVRNALRRIEAEQLARGVRGVRDVRNWLVTDDALVLQVQRALARDGRLVVHYLNVQVFLGVVHVRGQVSTPMQRALATMIAQQVPGVHAVNNTLEIIPIPGPHATRRIST